MTKDCKHTLSNQSSENEHVDSNKNDIYSNIIEWKSIITVNIVTQTNKPAISSCIIALQAIPP